MTKINFHIKIKDQKYILSAFTKALAAMTKHKRCIFKKSLSLKIS